MRNAWLALLLALSALPLEASADPATLPLLGDSNLHLYTQRAYEGFGPATEAAVDARYDELIEAGMDTARHLFDWRDLETSPGNYDRQLVIDAMDALAARGIAHQFPNLVVIDSGGPVVPAYIESLLAGGASWDDPRITGAFAELLDVFVPIMLDRGMFMLGLSNEPGGYYEDEPAAAATFKGFIAAAVAHAHELEPDLSCTVVFAGPTDPAIPDLMPLSDVATFNTYFYRTQADPECRLDGSALPLFRSDTADNVSIYLDDLIAAADGRLVNIQEIGQASAGATLGPATSEANQAAVYAALIPALDARRTHFRTVCNWTLNDHQNAWEPLGRALVDQGLPRCFADNVVDTFTETGLVRSDSTATPKPAFDIFKAGIGSLSELVINPGLNDAWYNPATSGQGFFISVLPDAERAFVGWFTFETMLPPGTATVGATEHRWLTAFGPWEGSVATLDVFLTKGGIFDDPGAVDVSAEESYGSMTIDFHDCSNATLTYDLFAVGLSGTIPIRRIAADNHALCEKLRARQSEE